MLWLPHLKGAIRQNNTFKLCFYLEILKVTWEMVRNQLKKGGEGGDGLEKRPIYLQIVANFHFY